MVHRWGSPQTHRRVSRNFILLLALLALLLITLTGSISTVQGQAGDPYSLIDAVNNLRAGNGLPAYQENSILMSVAQAHSEYQAAIGSVTHTGAGGTRPRDRAAAAGYGGGGTFFISENIAGGTDLSVDGAISMWLGDDPHIQTMLGASYQEIGAGVAVADGFVYYTIDVACVAGSGSSKPPATLAPGGPTAIPIYLVQTATPKPDGSIIHVVRSGQTLIGIAKAYGVLVIEIKDLNGLTSDTIYEGDKLLIRGASTPGPTASVTSTSTPTHAVTPTRKPTRTATPSATPSAIPTQAPTTEAVAQNNIMGGADPVGNILIIAIIILAAGGMVMMVVGGLLKRRGEPPAD